MMKKSQILAAIALAMALGVVAPITVAESASAAEDVTTTKAQANKNAQKELNAIYDSFGPITTYDKDNNGKATELKGEDAYKFYGTDGKAAQTITDASSIVSDLKKGGAGSIAAKLAEDVKGALTADMLKIDAVSEIVSDVNKWDNANLSTVIDNAKKIMKAVADEADTETAKETANSVSEKVADLISDKTIAASINSAIAAEDNAKVKALQDLYYEVTKETSPVINNEATLNQVLTAVNGKLPKVALYNRINEQVGEVVAGIANAAMSGAKLNSLVATLKKLVNGQITPAEAEEENKKNDAVNAPATGIAGTAEGTATTVSIVAGLATALTALGAGVVAYRSARRK